MAIKRRSPNYPGIDLRSGINVLRSLYEEVKRGNFTPTDAAKAWKYSSTQGPTKVRLAALGHFGLLNRTKDSNLKLSQDALTLVIRNESSREFRDVLRKTVQVPPLFREIQESMPEAAADALRQHLIVDCNFTDSGASKFIKVYRDSFDFVNEIQENDFGIDRNSEVPSDLGAESGFSADTVALASTVGDQTTGRPNKEDPHMRSIQIPLSNAPWATLKGPFPISEMSWEQMIKMLEAMKPGLVLSTKEATEEPERIRLGANEE